MSYKGLDILLRALERVPELRLDIVGSGPEGPRLRTLAQALAITDRVRWYGEYPDEDLPRRMADADFLVLPSVTVEEMFGLVVLEAMAAGRPVITTALPSAVREVNVPGETGLEVPLRDVPALAQALDTLSRDPGLRKRMGEAGRKRVASRFTQTAMAEKHIELYERIRGGAEVAAYLIAPALPAIAPEHAGLSGVVGLVPHDGREQGSHGLVGVAAGAGRDRPVEPLGGQAVHRGIDPLGRFVPRGQQLGEITRRGGIFQRRCPPVVTLQPVEPDHGLLPQDRQGLVVGDDQVAEHPVDAVAVGSRLDETVLVGHAIHVGGHGEVGDHGLLTPGLDFAGGGGSGLRHAMAPFWLRTVFSGS